MVFLAILLVDFYGKCIGKFIYTIHGSYGNLRCVDGNLG